MARKKKRKEKKRKEKDSSPSQPTSAIPIFSQTQAYTLSLRGDI
jgi:hypothetical protein